jgi:zinc and cadmium transporter
MMGVPQLVGWALPVSAGVTLYVAASDLVPEVNKESGTAIAITVFAGVVLYYLTELALGSFGL